MLVIGGGGFYIGRSIGHWECIVDSSEYQKDLETYLLHGEVLNSHAERAFKAYWEEKTEIAIWALESWITELQILSKEVTDNSIMTVEDINFDLTLTYARLSKMYSKLGDQENINKSNEMALFYSKKSGNFSHHFKDIKSILDYTTKIDKKITNSTN